MGTKYQHICEGKVTPHRKGWRNTEKLTCNQKRLHHTSPCPPLPIPVPIVTSFTKGLPHLNFYHESITASGKVLLRRNTCIPFLIHIYAASSINYFSKCSFPDRKVSGYQKGHLEGRGRDLKSGTWISGLHWRSRDHLRDSESDLSLGSKSDSGSLGMSMSLYPLLSYL